MSNLITTLTNRIEAYRKDTKNPCKNYGTQAAAERATSKMAKQAAVYFNMNGDENAESAEYVVFYVEDWKRWVGCINLTEVVNRKTSTGGYLGVCTGFFTY